MSYRRRSQSASTSASLPRRSLSTSCHNAVGKRTCHSSTRSNVSSSKWDVEAWRSKRRRRNPSPSGSGASSDEDFSSSNQSPANRNVLDTHTFSRPSFPSSSADFFPRKENTRFRHSTHIPTSFDFNSHQLYSQEELIELRSNAFWDLQRSIAENGESLVRRMRDYENSRSRAETYSKVKDAQKRGRKRSSLITAARKKPVYQDSDVEDDNEDDVQIFSGEITNVFLSSRGSQTTPSDVMTHPTRGRSLPGTPRCVSPCSSLMSDDDDSQMIMHHPPLNPPSIELPTLSQSASSANSSISSLSLHPSDTYLDPLITSPTASRSEKALAALSLAMANGAGSINDYAGLDFSSVTPPNDRCVR
ncbi:hypothetical protein VKT23_005664 [Stygiomarasmius scandens]|uniref:Uncharacterized protein n=1 Tax=Marasmiellus scandens TaxID=2682957 RepID=A0ABR1JVC4_9AGAR